ncbi:MAG: hypothetical protein RJA09_2446, partial [Pseudomonadota bacterium]
MANAKDLGALRQQYKTDKAEVMARIAAMGPQSRSIHNLLRRLARLTDHTLQQLWRAAQLPTSCALVAVGGYGRGELFPYSDVDVLVLLPDGTDLDADTAVKTRLEAFIGTCWDLGLEIGSSVRTLGDCVTEAGK